MEEGGRREERERKEDAREARLWCTMTNKERDKGKKTICTTCKIVQA